MANFTVNPDGTLSYAADLQVALTGQGTSAGVVGEAIAVNATVPERPLRRLRHYTTEKTAAAFTLHLLPGSHFVEGPSGLGAADFTVNPDGTVSYAANLEGALTGAGPRRSGSSATRSPSTPRS